MATLFNALRTKYRKRLDAFLKGTHHHFLNFIPADKGMFSNWILKIFYSGIKDNEDQLAVLRSLPDNACIVYLNKFKSYFEFLFYHTRYADRKLPVPELAFDYKIVSLQSITNLLRIFISSVDYLFHHWKLPDPYRDEYFRHEILNGTPSLLSLVQKKGFY